MTLTSSDVLGNETGPVGTKTRRLVVDCDIHNSIGPGALDPYLSQRWKRHSELFGNRSRQSGTYPKGAPNAARGDAWPPSGLPPGGDLDFMRTQHLDGAGIEFGILNCLGPAPGQLNADYAAALCHATNEWQIAEWLEKEPRLRAGICVPHEYGDLAADEVERMHGNPGFVQILLTVRTAEPLGRRKYWKLYEAAEKYDLPIGIHFGGTQGNPLTPSGWPSYYIEDHTGMALAFQSQVISFVCEGVFERFPKLKIVLIEGGFAWLPSLMWRLDQHWNRLREEVPHLRRRPSDYIRDHFWVTTQPMEEPHNPKHLLDVFEHHGATEKVMFSTDYPHWDYDAPDRAFPISVPAELRDGIFAGNAKKLYGLG